MCNWDGMSNKAIIIWRGRRVTEPFEPWMVLITLPGLPVKNGPMIIHTNLVPLVTNMIELMFDEYNNDRYNGTRPAYG